MKRFSLLREDLDAFDLVALGSAEYCPARLVVADGPRYKHIHECTRPVGHHGQHYSFAKSYEILWPPTDADGQPVQVEPSE